MSENSETKNIDDTIASAIGDAFDAEVYINKFVVVAEVIAPDGQRGIAPIISDTCELWDAIGLTEALSSDLKTMFSRSGYRALEGE